MKLLKNQQNLTIRDQEYSYLHYKLLKEVKKQNITFAYQNRLPFLVPMVLIDVIGILVAIYFWNNDMMRLFIIMSVLIGVFIFVSSYFYTKWTAKANRYNKKQEEKLEKIREQIFKEFFNEKFQDVKITKKLTMSECWKEVAKLKTIRTNDWMNGKKNKSKVVKIFPGYQLETENKIKLNFMILEVEETHEKTTKNSKGEWETTEHQVSYNYLACTIDNIDSRWAKTILVVGFSIKKRYKGAKLENDQFNSRYRYYCNSEIDLRVILSPWVQEKLVTAKFTRYTFEMHPKLVFWYGKGSPRWFAQNIKIHKQAKATYLSILQDIKRDFEILQKLVQDLSAYKQIIK